MRPDYFIPSGFIKRRFDKNSSNAEADGLFSLSKFLKKMFTRFKISFVDDCCEIPAEDQTALPVRYNAVEEELQRYDPDTDTWVAVS